MSGYKCSHFTKVVGSDVVMSMASASGNSLVPHSLIEVESLLCLVGVNGKGRLGASKFLFFIFLDMNNKHITFHNDRYFVVYHRLVMCRKPFLQLPRIILKKNAILFCYLIQPVPEAMWTHITIGHKV